MPELDHEHLSLFTQILTSSVFGLDCLLGWEGGGGGWGGYSAKFFTGESAQRLCDYRRRNEEWSQVQYSRMYYLMILDDYAIKA